MAQLTSVVHDLKDSRKAKTAMKHLAIPLVKKDVKVNGKTVQRFQAVVEENSGEVLSMVSPGYKLLRHDEALEGILKGLEIEGWDFQQVNIERSGAHAFVKAVKRGVNLMDGTKEEVFPAITLSNSVDLRGSIKAVFGAFRQVCENGLVVPDPRWGTVNFRSVHMGDLDSKFSKLREEFAAKMQMLKTVAENYRSLMNQQVKPEEAEKLLGKVVGKRQLERVMYLWEHAPGQPKPYQTKWGLYNGLTYWLTHEAAGGVYARDLKSQQGLQLLLGVRQH